MADYIPTDWQHALGGFSKNSKREYQDNASKIDAELIRKPGKKIVTYTDVHEKARTLPKTKLMKDQVNKTRGFQIDKTETPVQMTIKNDHLNSENTRWVPGYSMGTQFMEGSNREYNMITPKHNIIGPHKSRSHRKIINSLDGVDSVNPRKQLTQTPLFANDRVITNHTPIAPIEQPMIRVYNTP